MPDTLRPLIPVPFWEAIAWAKARSVVLPEVYYGELQGLARSMAFSIAGLAKLDQLQAVLDSLVANLESGESFGKWKKRVATDEIPLDLPPHRLETIFRSNLQGHYGRGRCEQQKRTVDSHPWYLLDAVNDSRTRPTHAAMDGKVARHDDPWWDKNTPPNGFQCVLPGTRVMGNMRVGLKAWYAGKAVEIHTASGVALTVTANHPVLTRRGWVRAQHLQKGDNLLCYLPGMEGAVDASSAWQAKRVAGMVDHQKAPPCAEEVFEALAAQRLGSLPAAAFDLYGDALALKSDVDVAGADSVLMDSWLTNVSQRHKYLALQRRNHLAAGRGDKALHAARPALISRFRQHPAKLHQALFDERPRHVQRLRDLLGRLFRVKPLNQLIIQVRNGALVGSCPSRLALALHQAAVLLEGRPLQRFGLATPAQGNPLALEPIANSLAAESEIVTDGLEAFAAGIAGNQGLGVFRAPAPRFNRTPATDGTGILNRTRVNPAVAQQSVEKAATDIALYEQLAHGCAGQIKIDQVIGIRDFAFSGHVYDFETENGLLTANGIITSNCRCRRIALTEAQAPRFIEADRKRLEKDPKLAEARALAEPDNGWDYSPCSDPTAGLRRAIADRLARCQDFTFAAKRPGQSGKTLVCDPHQYTNSHLRSLAGFLEADRQMPPVRHVAGIERLSPTLDEQRLFARFMQEFGGENRAAFTDVMGNVLEIDRHLFLNLKGEWKIMKGERAQWLLYTALNIRQPDEIWLEPGRQGGVDKRYYLSRFDVGRGPLLSCIAVFEREQERSGSWAGRTNYATTRTDEYIESKRKNKADLHYWRWER